MQIIEAIIKAANKISRASFAVKSSETTLEQKMHTLTNQNPEVRENLRTATEVTFTVKEKY